MDNKKLALIHIIKKELNLSEEKYRGILKQVAGVESAKDLDEEKFRKLMNFFVRSPYYQVNRLGLTMRQKLYIKHLVVQLSWEAGHLDNFLRKYYHRSNVDELSKADAIKVIESLKNISERKPQDKDKVSYGN